MLSVLVDTNVVLDFALGRQPWAGAAKEILQAAADGRICAVFAATSLKDVYYVARKAMGGQRSTEFLDYLMDVLRIGDVTAETCRQARAEHEDDFEDAVVAAVAREQAVDVIVSRGEAAFQHACAPKMDPRLFAAFFLHANSESLLFEMDLADSTLREIQAPSV